MTADITASRFAKLKPVVGYAVFGLAAFVVALYFTFPYDRVKDRIVAMLAAVDLDVQVGSAGPALGIGISLKDITVAPRTQPGVPAATNKPASRFAIDEASIRVSPLAAFLGGSGVSVSADAFGGTVDFERQVSKSRTRVTAAARDVDVGDLPWVKAAINLPLSGTLEVDLDVELPNGRYAEAIGSAEIKCTGCVIGDGKEKLKIAGNPLLAEGLSLPKVRLGDFGGRVAVEKGTAKLQGLQAKSPDGEISIEGEILLRDPLPMSTVRAYVRFKMSDALLKSSDKLGLLLQLAETMGKRPDGYFGLRVSGRLESLDPPEWSKISPFGDRAPAAGGRTGAGASGSRPSITSVRPSPVEPSSPSAAGLRPEEMVVADEPAPPPPPPVMAPPPAPAAEETPQPSPTSAPEEGAAAQHTVPVPPVPARRQAGEQSPPSTTDDNGNETDH